MNLITNLRDELKEIERKQSLIKNMLYELKDGIEPEFTGLSFEMEISLRFSDLSYSIEIIEGSMSIWERKHLIKNI